MQTFGDFDVIVVDDGSDDAVRADLEALPSNLDARIRCVHLPRRPRGHGSGFARNEGIVRSDSAYICLLDDDDSWTDPDYLARTHASLNEAENPVDLHFANQEAFMAGARQPGPIWLEPLADIMRNASRPHDTQGAYRVTIDDLLRVNGFCHLNCFVMRREFCNAIGGFDESLRYETDRDLYLRAIDAAETILYSPRTISRHNIPDRGKTVNVSTKVSMLEKRNFQLYLLSKAATKSRSPAMRRYARKNMGFTMKHIAQELIEDGRIQDALAHGYAGLGAKPSLGWAAYLVWLSLRALGARMAGR